MESSDAAAGTGMGYSQSCFYAAKIYCYFPKMTGRRMCTACAHARAAALWRHTAALTFREWDESQHEKKQHHANFFFLINICQVWREAQAAKFGCKIQRALKLEMFTYRLLILPSPLYRSHRDHLFALTVTHN